MGLNGEMIDIYEEVAQACEIEDRFETMIDEMAYRPARN
jgi:hypothetical protein